MSRVAVHLHGPFKDFHDGPIFVEASTPAEAVEAVTGQIIQFKPDINGRRRVSVVGCDTQESLVCPIISDELHIVPAMTFGKDGGIFEIVIGTVLVVAGFLLGGPGTPLGMFLISTGASMIIGGLMTFLAPQPELSVDEEEERSRYLGTPGNTVGIGTRIAVGYGENLWAGHFLSLDIDAVDVGV